MRTDKLASLRGPLVFAGLVGIPLVLWARSVPLEQRFTGQFATLTSIAVVARLRRNVGIRAQYRARRSAAAGRGAARWARPHVQDAPRPRPGRVRAAARARRLHPRGPGDDLDRTRPSTCSSPARAGRSSPVFSPSARLTLAIVLTLFVRLGHEVFVYVQRTFGFVFLVATYHVFTTPGAKEDSQALNLYLAGLATSVSPRSSTARSSGTCSCAAGSTASSRSTGWTSSSPRS